MPAEIQDHQWQGPYWRIVSHVLIARAKMESESGGVPSGPAIASRARCIVGRRRKATGTHLRIKTT
jgi:hypothetical protein